MSGLQRFVDAQDAIYATALAELKAGHKRTHWMWFVFPQMRGLGSSSHAQLYGIASLDEAKAYLAHDVLGQRLRECTQAVLDVKGRPLVEILGSVDAQKFRSSMTLFLHASGEAIFREALDRCSGGAEDERTIALL
ncbi:DUF1810 domain-containing protein [Roseococcus sp. SYP-B2431]|uniref:DUF1810 domain-containing protein n=1 Tax=Roseococcus sp. SYP-B2431 TaxID=2496640 RepID=UPI00103DEE58|nr:DUF1810 domain-containing protein [Roseococcus sp. SYP-B2431]TCH99080.1 DUF1810 domain-containing protein [Roseococcus sp. SYP-B2431]